MLVLQLFILPLIDAHRFPNWENPVPISAPKQHDLSIGKCTGTWSSWNDRDDPSGKGDYEIHSKQHKLCENAIAVEGRIRSSGEIVTTQNVELTLKGLYCKNYEQPREKKCFDYEVRFCCPKKSGINDKGTNYNLSRELGFLYSGTINV